MKEEMTMTVENGVRVMAGSMMLISLSLAHWVNPNWLWLGVFVGVNLIQSAFTGFCPAVKILKALGLKESAACCAGK